MYATNIFKPFCIEFLSLVDIIPETNINNYYWTAFAPRSLLTEKIELHVAHPTAGIIQVIEMEEKKLFFNN